MSSSFPPDSNEPPETDRYFVPPDPPLDPPSDGVDGGIDSSPMLESSGESLFPMTRPRPRAWTAIAIVVISLLVFIVASGVMAFAAFLIGAISIIGLRTSFQTSGP